MHNLFFVFALFIYVNNLHSETIKIAQKSPQICQLNLHCNDENPLWAKYVSGIDLAQTVVSDVLSEHNLSVKDFTKVTVADSGFDFYNQHSYFSDSFSIEKLSKDTGNLYLDIDGHGTAVSGLVAAKKIGYTQLINLNILRFTSSFAQKRAKEKLVNDAIIKGCNKADIVNISWTNDIFEKGKEDLNKLEWYKFAKKKGCLVIKSSGNNAFINRLAYSVSSDSPLLTVGSLDSNGIVSKFSSKAMIYTLGQGVYTLVSKQKDLNFEERNSLCSYENIPISKVSGTSFAAPLITASAAQVITILKARKILPNDPSKKLKLLRNILLAASKYSTKYGVHENQFNAYIASLIARNISITQINLNYLHFYDLLIKEKSKICLKSIKDCSSEKSCGEKYDCVKLNRKKSILCEKQQLDSSTNLIKFFKQNQENELYGYYTHKRIKYIETLNANSKVVRKYKLEFLDDIWKKITKNKIILSDAGDFLDLIEQASRMRVSKYSNIETFIYFIKKAVTFNFDHFDPKENSLNSTHSLGKTFSNIYLKYNRNDRTKVIDYFKYLLKSNSISSSSMSMLLQIYVIELDTNLKKTIEKIIFSITKRACIKQKGDSSISIDYVHYNNILKYIPRIKNVFKKMFLEKLSDLNIEFIRFIFENPQVTLGKEKSFVASRILNYILERKTFIESSFLKDKETSEFEFLSSMIDDIFQFTIHNDKKNLNLVKKLKTVFLMKVPLYLNLSNILSINHIEKATFNHKTFLMDAIFLQKFFENQIKNLIFFINKDIFSYAHYLDNYNNNYLDFFKQKQNFTKLGINSKDCFNKLMKLVEISISKLSVMYNEEKLSIDELLKLEVYTNLFNDIISKVIVLNNFYSTESEEKFFLKVFNGLIRDFKTKKTRLSYSNYLKIRKRLGLSEEGVNKI